MLKVRKIARRVLLPGGLAAGILLGVLGVRTASTGKAGAEVDPAPKVEIPEGAAGRLAGAIRIPTISPESGAIHGDAFREPLFEAAVRFRPDDRQPGRKEVPMDHGTIQKGHAHHDAHADHHDPAAAGELLVRTDPREARSEERTTLRLMIHGADGRMVKDFETVHEAKVHLIIVREGLDQFAHLHPAVDAAGNLSAEFRFPVGGRYRLFADFKPQGKPPSVAVGELQVAGPSAPAPRLSPDVPGRIRGEELEARIEIANAKAGNPVRISFALLDAEDQPVRDLQPYLGARGHLVVISADGKEYVHAHPGEEQADAGRVGFEARFAKPGIYKGWGQFRRGGKIHTLPLVLGVE